MPGPAPDGGSRTPLSDVPSSRPWSSPVANSSTLVGAASLGLGCDRGSKVAPPALEAGSTPFAGKAADLVLLTERPPNLEMPLHYLRHDLTPNEAFFWHLAGVHSAIDRGAHELTIGGHVERPTQLSLDEIERLDAVEIVHVLLAVHHARRSAARDPSGLGVAGPSTG